MTTPSASFLPPLPQQQSPVLADQQNIFSLLWRNYLGFLDRMFRTAQFGPLIAVGTPNNANAASAGVPLNGLYTSTANPAPVYIRTA